MGKRSNEFSELAAKVLAELGIQKFWFEQGGKHPAVVYEMSGRNFRRALPGTGQSRGCALNNFKSQLRQHVQSSRQLCGAN